MEQMRGRLGPFAADGGFSTSRIGALVELVERGCYYPVSA